MAKVILKIDGKNKTFVKDKLNLGAVKAQAEFEQKLQTGFSTIGELQNLYRKNRGILNKIEKVENKLADIETDEEAEKLYQELDELEATDEYKEFLNKSEELNEQIKEEGNDEDFEIYDEFANLLVKVFDNQFTIDEVFDGLEVENSLPDTYSKIFASNDAGKPKKKATTTKTKQQTK
ncbi:hypothetical protein FH105_04725 [Staphylococcus hominis]|uniref:phage tail assembly chaperone G n=1 Tax=Staphylococcus hominis TaxID=1290 RepID=UPI001F575242|nr:hypothetical protein [Staphylococcus hominis]MCI2864552.1 hypothetical protein [Staphylococcus hominis]